MLLPQWSIGNTMKDLNATVSYKIAGGYVLYFTFLIFSSPINFTSEIIARGCCRHVNTLLNTTAFPRWLIIPLRSNMWINKFKCRIPPIFTKCAISASTYVCHSCHKNILLYLSENNFII